MNNTILLIGDITDFDVIPNNIIEDVNIKKFTFDFNIHEILKNKNIDHEIADNLLNEEERSRKVDAACKKLLVNEIIEEYEVLG